MCTLHQGSFKQEARKAVEGVFGWLAQGKVAARIAGASPRRLSRDRTPPMRADASSRPHSHSHAARCACCSGVASGCTSSAHAVRRLGAERDVDAHHLRRAARRARDTVWPGRYCSRRAFELVGAHAEVADRQDLVVHVEARVEARACRGAPA